MDEHQSTKMITDVWLTPPSLIDKLGQFDIDPCSPIERPWNTAKHHYTIDDDGLNKEWKGRVWCNPPYGRIAETWLKKLSEHNNGIALIFARTETNMFFNEVWEKASALLFIKGRIHFHHVDGTRAKSNAGAPSVLVAYGLDNKEVLRDCKIAGKFIEIK